MTIQQYPSGNFTHPIVKMKEIDFVSEFRSVCNIYYLKRFEILDESIYVQNLNDFQIS